MRIVSNSESQLVRKVRKIAENVPDPEIPALTLGDLGIVREVEVDEQGVAQVKITPTYTGCPAVSTIENDVVKALERAAIDCKIERVISPPWSTDWITASGQKKLKDFGIAPPDHTVCSNTNLFENKTPDCPKCNAADTVLVSQFGSTPCKAHYKCENCLEPFDYFKCL